MKILKALYAVELLLAAGAEAGRAGRDGSKYLKGRNKGKRTTQKLRRLPPKGDGGSCPHPPGDFAQRVDSCPGGHDAWNFCSTDPVDVIIVGAGTAAMAAGRFIERYNELNTGDKVTYKILEADGDGAAGTAPNLGRVQRSMWIHGGEGNPLYEIKYLQENVRGDPVEPEWQTNWADVKRFRCGPQDYGDAALSCSPIPNGVANAERNEFRAVEECVRDITNLGNNVGDDLGICYLQETGDSNWLANGDRSRIWNVWDYEYAEDPRSTSNEFLAVYECTGQDKDFHLNNGVYPIVLREYEFYGIDDCTCAGVTVDEIRFLGAVGDPCVSDHCVEVEADGGTLFHAKQVILTPSVGVLARGAITIPELGVGETKYNKMMNIFFSPDDTLTDRATLNNEHNPLYYVVAFQFSDAKATWDDDYAFINVDFVDPGASPFDETTSRRVMCRMWEVWNDKWGDWHHEDNNMIACALTTEDVEFLEKQIGAGAAYSIPEYDGTVDSALDTAITNLFRNSIGKAYGIDIPVANDCYRCGSPVQDCTNTAGTTRPRFNPNVALSSLGTLGPNECRYRVFPNKENPLWYGSYENVNDGAAFSDPGDFGDFIAPIDNPNAGATGSIHMAGAATCYNYYGFLQGSYYSAIRAANASLTASNIGATGSFPCDEKLDRDWCANPPPFSIGNPRGGCVD